MGEAASQAAAVRTAEYDALEALRLDWGAYFRIGYDDERGWWAARYAKVGGLLTAQGPDELRAAMAEDYAP
jgi:hypothetical protein